MNRTRRFPWLTVSGTGHRELHTGDTAWVAEQLPQACAWLRDVAGTRFGVSGLARSFDMDWAEAILDAGLKLCVAIPFEDQPARWTRADKARWHRLRAAAHSEKIVGHIPADLPTSRRGAAVNAALFKRNRFMLDRSDAVLALWEPGRMSGGTAGALLEAAKRRLPGVHLDPIARKVNFELPGPDQLQPYVLQRAGCGHIATVSTWAIAAEGYDELENAHFVSWHVRPARPRETADNGCDTCIPELAAAATARLTAPA